MKKKISNNGLLTIFIVIGALAGTLTGEILGSKIKALDFLKTTCVLGTPNNLSVNLKFISLTFGLNICINLMTIIGIILAIILYKRH